ncbi:CpaD family pilus assembly protein [Sphingomonas glaciei]|uniref:CpaD family pilus assembly protein n=1 Tax=Sphingomonas glaciei TaxID=2938948 RepID=A0ABY5MU48_9SPHN|nr:CpaD family pilus assembly protein [Sphingomonas glaciei]UUR08020.1 CpaD family pilus assembly protein [Sphingomonas glaciei]
MIKTLPLLLLSCVALAGCQVHRGEDRPARGLEAVNVPVVSRADYVFDAAAPGGVLAATEAARLDGWLRGLELGYGDSIGVDGVDAVAARADVARVAGRYGLLLSDSVPITAGVIPPGSVRVVVTRTRASVPGCPNWSQPSTPNYSNETMSNFGCGVNSNLAAMVANPADLVSGRESSSTDASLGNKAIEAYRSRSPKVNQVEAASAKGN